ncbi:LuxR family transcriptional regulator [Lutibacter profundi]|uniref:LuxR family transcriptional regulator n=1 Tax=Lutibacter profundi TaxID=1622118 RepID=A0A0X8G5B4_9FLAO|nr:response regulator transcription factor [Lutibacter profundi]AMC10305.1 LuxR family transcriptional regulator [Lutibacter profundi]
MRPIHLAIIEDDLIIQESLVEYFGLQDAIEVVLVASSVEEFLKKIMTSEKQPSILLLDINLPGISGLEGLPLIKNKLPELDVMMLTTFDETDKIFKALSCGACSYMSKRISLQKILEAVLIVNEGGSYMSPAIARKIANYYAPKKKQLLTERQLEIVEGIVAGQSYKMIAADLFVSIDTVRSHIKNIYKTLEINCKAELIRKSFDKEI